MTDIASAAAAPSPRSSWIERTGPIPGWGPVWPFLAISVQLGALLVLMRLFQIEPGTGLPRILPLVFAGFVIHAALPMRWRLPFFLLLSVVAIGTVLGPIAGVVLILLGLLLIGVCHLPVAFSTRVLLLFLIGGALAAVRAGWLDVPSAGPLSLSLPGLPKMVLPVLGSMFMFRLIIYLYDLRHEERARLAGTLPKGATGQPASVWTRLSYFFLLPNVCFLLFPIVDYRTYRRTYYDSDAQAIYQKGVWWICLGLVQLLLYRLVYYYLVPSAADVQGLPGIARFMLAAYLIYLRVVGQFQLIAGLLCLFGFNLPPAHRFYLLASSFTDFWRRARIEWKDFMVKVFYYPTLVPLQRRFGATPALIVSTVSVFLVTWLLHGYQWFWLIGDFRLLGNDGVFWMVIGSSVLINSLLESRKRRARPGARWDTGQAVVHSAKVVGMFVFMCVLWSYWSSPSFAIWLSYLTAAKESGLGAYGLLVAAVLAVVGAGVLAQLIGFRFVAARNAPRSGPVLEPKVRAAVEPVSWATPAWMPAAVLMATGVLLLVRVPITRQAMAAPLASVVTTLSSNTLNAVDQEREDRGYYEELLDVPRSPVALASADAVNDASTGNEPSGDTASGDTPSGKSEPNKSSSGVVDTMQPETIAQPQKVFAVRTDTANTISRPVVARRLRPYERMTNDMTMWENVPNFVGAFKGAPVLTNRWGMRDKDYQLVPPPRTYRMALLGTSMTVGAGVPVEQNMETVLEDRLNREGPGVPKRRYEILNFSVGEYGIMQNVAVLDEKVFAFRPNAVLVGIFSVDAGRMSTYLTKLVSANVPIRYPYVKEKLREAGVNASMEEPELLRRLEPISEDLVRWSYRHIIEVCRQRGVSVLGIVLPEPRPKAGHNIDQSVRLATDAGLPLLDLREVYAGQPVDSFRLADKKDPHWNARGHKFIADRVYELLSENDARALNLGFPARR